MGKSLEEMLPVGYDAAKRILVKTSEKQLEILEFYVGSQE